MMRVRLSVVFLLTLFAGVAVAKEAQQSERCRLIPDKGPCKAMISKYFFDQSRQRCVEYFYDGCGAVVPFDDMASCQKSCETPGEKHSTSSLRHDPIENDPRYAVIFATIDKEVDALLADDPARGAMGFCHRQWSTKQELLKSKYGIDWRSPAEMNPEVIFD
jgi:hypothetical protein